MPLVQPLTKHRVQVAIHMHLYTMLTQLAIDGEGTCSVNLAPKWNVWVEDGAQRVVTIGQKSRAAPISPAGKIVTASVTTLV